MALNPFSKLNTNKGFTAIMANEFNVGGFNSEFKVQFKAESSGFKVRHDNYQGCR